ncbi:TAT-variant-translocated molybdopterin oxidoreductase [Sorangium sp. So ce1151]|uniref:TAT-variant-translocated molybdopterin oxidoreductase n=1 Tax=Sorangium sp. So ce1151 TaxID=3133332 RepID=UPI003F632EAB
MKRTPLPLAQDLSGKTYWRSLNELAGSPDFIDALGREFPPGAIEPPADGDGVGRRTFLSLMGASLALGGLVGCRRPVEQILPYSRAPEEVIPGQPLFFATALPMMGTAFGVIVESHEGRPTKIEGNPKHPESLGATTIYTQAAVLDLYDPDRSTSPREGANAKSWDDAATFLRAEGDKLRGRGGKGLTILTEAHRSPTLAARLADLRKTLPEARVVRYEPFSRDAAREGARLAFGRPLETALDLTKARVIVALDADLFGTDGSPVKQARGFAAGRAVDKDPKAMNRLYAVESTFTITGASSDHRLRIQSRKIPAFTFALAAELGKRGVALDADLLKAIEGKSGGLDAKATRYVAAIAADLAESRGQGAVVAGRSQPKEVHALAHLINAALDNIGKAVRLVAPFDESREGPEAIVELARSIERNEVETLLILGGNPAFDAPADARFADALAKVPVSVHVSTHVDETSERSRWHLNRAHPLESWGDVRAEDGTASIVQPLIAPLFGGRTDAEVIELLLGGSRTAYDLVRATWLTAEGAKRTEQDLRRALHDGVLAGSELADEQVAAAPQGAVEALRAFAPAAAEGLEVTFRPDVHAWDGRFANNGWLQELPHPMTKLTWGNGASLSPSTAARLNVKDGDIVTLSGGGASVRIPVVVAPGQADDSVAISVGQGRRAQLRVGRGVGVDTTPLRKSDAFELSGGFSLERAGEVAALARTQEHFVMEGRPLAREGTLAELQSDPEFAQKQVHVPPLLSLFKEPNRRQGHAWGMSIDLNACIGCNACVVACQAENNIPVVGADGVRETREMHWLRIDRYYQGTDPNEPESIQQPLPCQHCENAPCEQVCPVAATAHSPEGLNDMAYNRCVGTKYCANNCPYKVRRFNFFEYGRPDSEQRKMQFNPNVTVRSRGVMEKCTFCVQRINHAKIEAKREGREHVKDGEIVTACQGACPTRAIIFGDLNDQQSQVSVTSASPRGYRLLDEINTKPRVTYLAKIRNKNPELADA